MRKRIIQLIIFTALAYTVIKRNRTIHLIIFTALAYAVIKSSTIGWYFWSGSYPGGADNLGSATALKAHVVKLAVEIGPRDIFQNNNHNLKKSLEYISGEFRNYGYKVEYQEYTVDGMIAKNIIAVKPGVSAPLETIIIGAHYDSYNNPGADDNASGVAGVLELAKRLAKKPLARTVKFIAFTNEEPPFFHTPDMGSMVYAKAAAERNEDIKGVVILEMIGYYSEQPFSQEYPPLIGFIHPNKGNFIAQISNLSSRKLARNIDSVFKNNSGLPIETIILPSIVPGVDWSDHRSFWQHGYPAVMFTDTAFYRNPNYHRPTDLPETLNYDYMAELINGLEPALIELAGADIIAQKQQK